jgi:hypothetical protein
MRRRHPSTDVIARARKKFDRPRSALHRSVKRELDALSRSCAQLEAAFVKRASDRETKVRADHTFAVEQVVGELAQLRRQLAALRGLKDAGLSQTSRALLTAAGKHVAAVRGSRAIYDSAAQVATEADKLLRQFNNRLVAAAVAALNDDAAVDRTIALLSGGTILGGLVVAPVTFAVAGIGLLVADVRKRWSAKARMAAADREALRLEIAAELIGAVRTQQDRWLAIFAGLRS